MAEIDVPKAKPMAAAPDPLPPPPDPPLDVPLHRPDVEVPHPGASPAWFGEVAMDGWPYNPIVNAIFVDIGRPSGHAPAREPSDGLSEFDLYQILGVSPLATQAR